MNKDYFSGSITKFFLIFLLTENFLKNVVACAKEDVKWQSRKKKNQKNMKNTWSEVINKVGSASFK